MALRSFTWGLADAALSNGAVLKAAAGGLPQRVAAADALRISNVLDKFGSIVFDADNSGAYWCSTYGPPAHLRHVLADGTVDADLGLVQNAMGLVADPVNGDLLLARYQNQTVERRSRADGSLIATYPVAGINASRLIVPPGAGTAWVGNYGSNLWTEFTTSFVATGRSFFTGIKEGTATPDGLYIWGNDYLNTRRLDRFRLSDLGLDLQIIRNPDVDSGREGSFWNGYCRGFIVDSQNRLLVFVAVPGVVDRWNSDGSYDRRLLHATYRGSVGATDLDPWTCFPMALSADEAWFAIAAQNSSGLIYDALLYRTGAQTAEWSKTFASAATLKFILVPGALSNEQDATYDERKTTCYYSLDGVTYTAATPGTPLSVAILAGTTLRVKAAMTVFGVGTTGIAPWIGGDSGEGPTVIWDDGSVQGAPLGGSIAAGAALGGSIAAGQPLGGSIR